MSEDKLAKPLFEGEQSAHNLPGLDILVSLDEPEALMLRLKELADQAQTEDKRWRGISRLCDRFIEYMEVINRPQSKED